MRWSSSSLTYSPKRVSLPREESTMNLPSLTSSSPL